METKGKSELVFSQNNCVSKRGFVVLIKALQIILKLYVCKPFLNLFLSMMGQGNHSPAFAAALWDVTQRLAAYSLTTFLSRFLPITESLPFFGRLSSQISLMRRDQHRKI